MTTFAIVTALGVAACSRDRERSREEVTLTAAELVVPNDTAIQRIVDARCAREAACSRIGAGRVFVSRDECVAQLGAQLRDRVGANACPLGVDRAQLDDCLREVESETCANPVQMFDRFLECRATELCPRLAR